MKKTFGLILLLVFFLPCVASAQDLLDNSAPLEGLPTIISIRTSAGWGIGRGRQLYGYNGSAPVYWSTGEGVKLHLALDVPILPVLVVDSSDIGAVNVPLVGLELEAGTGYELSTGGTTNDATPYGTNAFVTTKRTTAYVPVTLGLNARASFGAGLPSVYVGAGGGVYLVALYEEAVTNSGISGSDFTRKMTPPLPFGLYGALGMEIPLLYNPDDGNSMFDLFGELRLTDMTSYIYSYQVVSSNGSVSNTDPLLDSRLYYLKGEYQRSASSVSLSLGFKYNLY